MMTKQRLYCSLVNVAWIQVGMACTGGHGNLKDYYCAGHSLVIMSRDWGGQRVPMGRAFQPPKDEPA
jgi:hypothetical protein